MSWLTKAIPALSKKNLGATIGGAMSNLGIPGGGLVAKALGSKGASSAVSQPAVYTMAPVTVSTLLPERSVGNGDGNIVTDLFGRVNEAAQDLFGPRKPGNAMTAPNASGGGLIPGVDIPVSVSPLEVKALRAPRGYVLVTNPRTGGKIAVLKTVAYALGLRKRPKRAAITSRDLAGARRVQGFIKKYSVARHAKTPIRSKARRKS